MEALRQPYFQNTLVKTNKVSKEEDLSTKVKET